jgi:hypothetical protein
MRTRATNTFTSITTEGALLPADLLRRIADGDKSVDGLSEASYHLTGGEKLGEAISRSWTRLTGAWKAFRTARERLPGTDLGTTLTRDRWLLTLFQELGYGRLGLARGLGIDGVSYPVSHLWQNVPIHLVSFRTELDTRTSGVAGAARRSPHSLVQELLNKSDNYLWGFVSNGLTLRILRDNASLTRQAYVEFDLTAMFDGDVFSDFAVLWLLAHESRVEAEKPTEFWLELWSKLAREQGVRALDQLRVGVERAIQALGSGFLAHPANNVLKERLRSGALDKQDYYRQLLRLVYRLLFLFVAEDRDVLFTPGASNEAKNTYRDYYSTARLRQLAVRRTGTRHGDLWEGLRLVMEFLGRDDGCLPLALPALGSFLFSSDAIVDLARCSLANRDILTAVRELSVTDERGIRRQVDFRNLRSEELGSVYEALLEQHPEIHAESATFSLSTAAGHERKTSGSYYTPDSLVQSLLDSALEPVIAATIRKPDPERAILDLKVCDPACGSGHFLVAAAHRIAKRLAAVRTGDEEPSPEATRHALRDVIGRCIYGVDLNPMAVELCKVALWMEAIEPGRPLSFLDHHIQCGNSLLGTTPALLAKGIPDEAFEPLIGDDKKFCSALKKRNRQEREGQLSLPLIAEPRTAYGSVRSRLEAIGVLDDATIEGIRAKERRWREMADSPDYRNTKLAADAWCAAFVCPKRADAPPAITHEVLELLRRDPARVPAESLREIVKHAEWYQFLHWHLAFPNVFSADDSVSLDDDQRTGWRGGFDVLLGNPPWDKIQPEEQKFFAPLRPDIAYADTAKMRKELIEALPANDPVVNELWIANKRRLDATCHLVGAGGFYRYSGAGNLNTYRLFTELASGLLADGGRAGLIVQTGLATDESGKELFDYLLSTGRLVEFFDFENRLGFFADVDSRFRFSLVTLADSDPSRTSQNATFGWLLHSLEELQAPDRLVRLSASDLLLFSPTSKTCPIFVSQKDLEISRWIYARSAHVYMDDDRRLDGIDFLGELFNLTRDSRFFLNRSSRGDGDYLPLYEAKYLHQFDHRFATTTGGRVVDTTSKQKEDPHFHTATSRLVEASEVKRRLAKRGIATPWFCGFRDISSATNERTAIMSLFPLSAVGNSINLVLGLRAPDAACLTANVNAFVFDYTCRQKVSGTHVNIWIFKQLPAIGIERYDARCGWSAETLRQWLLPRILELTYTAWDLASFAKDCGYNGPPFVWDDDRRAVIRAELDAAFFNLYLGTQEEWSREPSSLRDTVATPRNAVEYIMGTFPIVQRDDEKAHGEYRTKRVILEIYDAMADAVRTGQRYQTRLDPPPADPRVAHASRTT